jgi:hypothetical protein
MKYFNPSFLFFLSLFFSLGCKNEQPKLDLESLNVELMRGNIVLCGGFQFGQVSFSLTFDKPIRDTFNLAVSLLHSFEYAEAEKAFVKVIDKDPNCVMAYWGVAMSIYHALWAAPSKKDLERGEKILNFAQAIPKTKREQDYFDAINIYYKNWEKSSHKSRALKYEKMMEKICNKYPDDKEAAIFYALALNSTANKADKEYKNQRKAGKILESIFPDQPNHPGIAHYLIHNYDNPVLAKLALSTARQYANIAPSSAHAQHMPSHIFTRLGLWEESIQSNLNSASSAICYVEENEMPGNWSKEIHAIAYLVYAYLQQGNNAKANEQYQYLKTMNIVSPVWDHRAAAYPFAAIPTRIVLENKQWEKASNLKIHTSNIDWERFPWQKAILHFGRSLGASHIGEINLAESQIAIMHSLHQELENREDQYGMDQVMIQIKTAQAWLNFAKGKTEQAITLMQEAVTMEDNTEKHPVTPSEVLPAKELLGDLFLAMNRPLQALQAYESNLERNPNRFNGIYGAAVAARSLGDKKKTRIYFERLQKLTEGINSDRDELKEADEFLSQS